MNGSPRELAFRHQLEKRALAAYLKAEQWKDKAERLQRKAKSKILGRLPRRKRLPENFPALVSSARLGEVGMKWPFRAALKASGLSPRQWAEQQRRPRVSENTVKGWLKKPGRGGRKCPQLWADRIAKEFVDGKGRSLVPAVDGSWPCGISRIRKQA